MQIRIGDLPDHLARRLLPIYLVHGDEPLLVIEAGDLIRNAARRAGCEEREVLVADTGFNWDQLLASTQNLSLFGSRKLIDLRIPSGRPGAAGAAALQSLARTASGDNVALVTLPRADRATQSSAWFTALEKSGASIAAHPLTREELPAWIGSRLGGQQQQATRQTLEFLAERTEGNLLAGHQEIVKLGLLLPPGALRHEDVERAVTDVARFDILDLSEAWLGGNARRVVRIVQSLRAEGDVLQLTLWQLGEDLHALFGLAEARASGVPLAQALRNVRAWGKRQNHLEAAARRLSREALAGMLAELAQLDALSKGIGRGSVWDRLVGLALALAGRALPVSV